MNVHITATRRLLIAALVSLTIPAAAQDQGKSTPPSPGAEKSVAPSAPKNPKKADVEAEDEEGVVTGVGSHFNQTSTPLVNEKGLFEAMFTHRFVEPVREAGGSRAFGLDSGASIGLGMDYSFVKNVALQIFRQSTDADYEFALKATVLRPKKKFPLAIGLRGGLDWETADYVSEKHTAGFAQLLVSVTLGDRVTLAASPTYVSRTPGLNQRVFNVPLNVQIRITNSIAAIGEYVFARKGRFPKIEGVSDPVDQWSFAIEKGLYHHKFALWIGNTPATAVNEYIAGDFAGDRVSDSNIRIGFNLSRQFEIATK